MITLWDTIEIKTSPKNIFEWFAHLDKNFRSWHPKDHVECRYVKGSPLEQGSILYFEVYLLGKLQKAKFHITNVVPNSREAGGAGAPGCDLSFAFCSGFIASDNTAKYVLAP